MPRRRAIALLDKPSARSVSTLQDVVLCGSRDTIRKDQGDLCGLTGTDHPQTRHVREQLREPIGERPVLNVEGQTDWPRFGPVTQVAGLSPIVSATFFVSSPRRSPSVTFWPTLSGPSARKTDRMWRMGSSFQETMMSPWCTPALAPGP